MKPMKAVFDPEYVKRINGPNVKQGPITRWTGAQADGRHRPVQERKQVRAPCDDLVRIHRSVPQARGLSSDIKTFEEGLCKNDPNIAPSQMYAYAALQSGVPFANGAPNLTTDIPALLELAQGPERPDLRKRFQDRPDVHEDSDRARAQGSHARSEGWFSTNILGNRDGEVLEDPGSFKTKEETKLSVLEQILQPDLYPDSVQRSVPLPSASTTIRLAVTPRKAGTTSTSSGGSAIPCRSRSIFCAAIRYSRRRSCWIWCCSWISRNAPGCGASRNGYRSTSKRR